MISTHALREEGDPRRLVWPPPRRRFLPTPSARRATWVHDLDKREGQFLPTPSARRATFTYAVFDSHTFKFLPTPSARRATRPTPCRPAGRLAISTHALREEGDESQPSLSWYINKISTHALREEGDNGITQPQREDIISTHALREEGDRSSRYLQLTGHNFYPRPPRGGRRPDPATASPAPI